MSYTPTRRETLAMLLAASAGAQTVSSLPTDWTLTQASEAEVNRFWLERYGYRSAREAGGAHDCP